MKVIDIVKPKPTTELEAHLRWKNRLHSELACLLQGRKKIEVKYIDKITCTGYGRTICERNGEHSWFNHAVDSYQGNPRMGDLPEHLKGDERFDG